MSTLSLVHSLVGVVTLYYLLSPYIIKPHPHITANITQLTATNRPSPSYSVWSEQGPIIENWTKWRLYLHQAGPGGEHTIVYPQSFVQLKPEESEVTTTFEWRPEYVNKIYTVDGKVKVEDSAPFLSSGIYNHYRTSVSEDGKTVQFLPNFLFGIPNTVLEKIYNGAEDLPLRGLFLKSVTGDRLIVQTFMICVGCTVVLILRSQEK